MAHRPMKAGMQECIDRCHSCEATCLESVQHCLKRGGKHADPDHIGMLLTCAEICNTSARFMLMGSEYHTSTCDVCAAVCEACADDCDGFSDDEMMQQCAAACRRCAESCREMAETKARA